jgi:hypothetical protein
MSLISYFVQQGTMMMQIDGLYDAAEDAWEGQKYAKPFDWGKFSPSGDLGTWIPYIRWMMGENFAEGEAGK